MTGRSSAVSRGRQRRDVKAQTVMTEGCSRSGRDRIRIGSTEHWTACRNETGQQALALTTAEGERGIKRRGAANQGECRLPLQLPSLPFRGPRVDKDVRTSMIGFPNEVGRIVASLSGAEASMQL